MPHPDKHMKPFPWWPQAVRLGYCLKNALNGLLAVTAGESQMLKIASRKAGRCKKGQFGDGERANWLMGWRVPC